jgi:phosphatidylserine/phosphatidylglycerophosphate/cardiolipin synthase-like enzyme
VRLLEGAVVAADICVFTITDDRIADAILEAHRRGVRVRILTDDCKTADPGSDIAWLRRADVPVVTDRRESHMHHKFAVIDRHTLVVGSYNWTRAAARENHEDLLVLRDSGLASTYQERFERLWREMGADGGHAVSG